MHLTQQTDYALRMLIFLAQAPTGAWIGVRQVSDAFGVSHNHMLKVTQALAHHGLVHSKRGVTGGVRLAMDPSLIQVGLVVRKLEGNLGLAECMRGELSCPLAAGCALQGAYHEALAAFFDALDRYTISDCAAPALARALWTRAGAMDVQGPSSSTPS